MKTSLPKDWNRASTWEVCEEHGLLFFILCGCSEVNQTDNRYTLLYGLTLFEPDDRTPLCSVEEVADFLLTHDGGIITEPDGAVLLEVEDREFVFCTDSEYKDELMRELRKSEGFEDRFGCRFPAKTNKKRKGL